MTTRTASRIAAALLLGATAARAALASAGAAKLGTGSFVRLDGTSTLHPYSAETKTFRADLRFESGAAAALSDAVSAQAPAKLTVTIPVASLKSEHSGLDKNLQKALRADKNPDIVFSMKGYRVTSDSAPAIVAWGDLSVAGTTKAETLNAALSWKDGHAVLDGQQPLLMTDFAVKPPAMMLGAVKTDDRIVVKFHLVLEPAADESKGEPRR